MARDLREEWTLQRDLSQGHSGAERRTARTQSGGDGGGDPPLPIPNRAVKPASADGTARKGGRVGYRRCSRGSDDGAMSFTAAPFFCTPPSGLTVLSGACHPGRSGGIASGYIHAPHEKFGRCGCRGLVNGRDPPSTAREGFPGPNFYGLVI